MIMMGVPGALSLDVQYVLEIPKRDSKRGNHSILPINDTHDLANVLIYVDIIL
jgi:hypothetical protein